MEIIFSPVSIDSKPPHGFSPYGHVAFAPVQTAYKPSVVFRRGILEDLWRNTSQSLQEPASLVVKTFSVRHLLHRRKRCRRRPRDSGLQTQAIMDPIQVEKLLTVAIPSRLRLPSP